MLSCMAKSKGSCLNCAHQKGEGRPGERSKGSCLNCTRGASRDARKAQNMHEGVCSIALAMLAADSKSQLPFVATSTIPDHLDAEFVSILRSELLVKSAIAALALGRAGVSRGDRVILLLPHSIEQAITHARLITHACIHMPMRAYSPSASRARGRHPSCTYTMRIHTMCSSLHVLLQVVCFPDTISTYSLSERLQVQLCPHVVAYASLSPSGCGRICTRHMVRSYVP